MFASVLPAYYHYHGHKCKYPGRKIFFGQFQATAYCNVMIGKDMLQLIFSGSCLWRWNDKLRPIDLSEIEKQAHKMLIACALWHEKARGQALDESSALAREVIEGGLFDYFYRLVITDIKPPVFYKIRENREQYLCLTEYVHKRLEPVFAPLGDFWRRMQAWHLGEGGTQARDILRAAHLYASRWEFQLIRPFNEFDDEMESIAQSFAGELGLYDHLPGMPELMDSGSALASFGNLCGQLRFQIRWTQAPRMPRTSVLGHMFIVAVMSYLYGLSLGSCRQRCNNNFFSGLFHDFPEVLTRDIISPVKRSVDGLSEIIRKYGHEELERRVLGPLKRNGFEDFAERVSWYLGLDCDSEFEECCVVKNKVVRFDDFRDLEKFNNDEFDPRDGKLVKVCDLLAAFLEAHNSINNGVASPQLVEGRERIKTELATKKIDCMQIESLLADFD